MLEKRAKTEVRGLPGLLINDIRTGKTELLKENIMYFVPYVEEDPIRYSQQMNRWRQQRIREKNKLKFEKAKQREEKLKETNPQNKTQTKRKRYAREKGKA